MRLDQIAAAFIAAAGGTATVEEVAHHIAETHPDVYREETWRAWCAAIRKAMTFTVDGGLPNALSVDNHGTYRQLALLDVGEYRFGIARYMRQARQSRAKAYLLAEECRRVHDVWIDPATVLEEETA